MITRTEWFSANDLTKGIHQFEEAGWAVRQIVTSVSGNGYIVVFEEIAVGSKVPERGC